MRKTLDLNVVNVVSAIDLDIPLDLDNLHTTIEGSHYDPSRFPALILKYQEPKLSALVFRNGKVNASAPSVESIQAGVRKLVNEFRDLGIEVNDPEMRITNVVATVDLGLSLNLDDIALNVGDVEYEPEQFPGLVIRPNDSNIAVLAFSTGKCVVVGGKDMKEIRDCIEMFYEQIMRTGMRTINESKDILDEVV